MIKTEEVEMARELERFPVCPALTSDEVAAITSAVFVHSNPQKADVLFVFGSSYGQWEQVAELYKRGLVPKVFIAGGIEDEENSGVIMSHAIQKALVGFAVPEGVIILDERSRNTLEDAAFGREIFISKDVPHRRILFAAKAPHSGRCLKTLKKVFPDSELFPFVYDFVFRGETITENISETWWQSDLGRSYVYGEYQRILLYSKRGDI